jgi:hypothetical protein
MMFTKFSLQPFNDDWNWIMISPLC